MIKYWWPGWSSILVLPSFDLLWVTFLGQIVRKNPSSCYRSPSIGDHVSDPDINPPNACTFGPKHTRMLRFLNGGVLRNLNMYSFKKLYPGSSATWLSDKLKPEKFRKYSLIIGEIIFFLGFLGMILENKPAAMVSVLQISYVYQINTLGSFLSHALSHYSCNNSSE